VYNFTGKWQGNLDVDLSENGKKQALEASKKLGEYRLDIIFASDLLRANDTAHIIRGNLHSAIEIRLDKRLRERGLGIFEGKTTAEIQRAVGRDLTIREIISFSEPDTKMETVDEQFIRGRSFLEALKMESYKNVLVVSHGVMIGVLLEILTGKDFRDRKIENCEIISVNVDNFNPMAHC
jgi:probable phosphoglycerate mutase